MTGLGVHGANQAPGTCSQATVFVVDTWGFSTHKDKEGQSQCEGLSLLLLIVHLCLGADCGNSCAGMCEYIKLTALS